MASTPTDDGTGASSDVLGIAPATVPAPRGDTELQRVPGVLGSIARERAADYREAEVPARASATPRNRRPATSSEGAATPPLSGRVPGRLRAALAAPGLSIVAEIKRGSPSAGAIANLDPVDAAHAYRRGGAAALSVLTEPRHFGGELAHLRAVAADGALPAMRKEFVVHPAQVKEAAEAGAAAVLLIAAVLGEDLEGYLRYARSLGLDALVEVHDEAELQLALEAGCDLLGVNNRDLRSLDVDRATAPRLLRRARELGFDGVTVAESGYGSAEDLRSVIGLADGALIGTALAGSGDLEAALRRLRSEVAELENTLHDAQSAATSDGASGTASDGADDVQHARGRRG